MGLPSLGLPRLSLPAHVTSIAAMSKGTGAPPGHAFMVDENDARMVDESGAYLIGQSAPAYSTLKAAAAARGIKFGAATNTTFMATNAALVTEQCAMLGFSGGLHPSAIQPTQGNFDFTSLDDAVEAAASLGLPWRFHLLNYPAHDMDWVDETTVTSGTWQGLIDAHFEAIATRLAMHANGSPTSIDVTNELADGSETDGFLRHPWYNAGGREWASYMFFKARALWPNTPLYLCQDLQEEIVPLYGDRFEACLNVVDFLLGEGAPIDGINLQAHLAWNRPWDPMAFRDQLREFRDRGLRIIVAEHDVQMDEQLTWAVPDGITAAEIDRRTAYRAAQWADIVLPFIDGGEFLVWELSDAETSWGADQRPCLYDDELNVKPAYYRALLEPMMTRL